MATHHFKHITVRHVTERAERLSYCPNDCDWTTHDVQYLLDIIKEKDEVIRQLSSGDYFVHY